MKPKLSCQKCGTELKWGEESCSSCHTSVDWSFSKETGSVRCELCGALMGKGDERCPSCKEMRPVKREQPKRKSLPSAQAQSSSKGKSLFEEHTWIKTVGLIVAIVALVIILDQAISPDPRAPSGQQSVDMENDHEHDHSVSANMAALPQIEEMEKEIAVRPNDHDLILRLAGFLQQNGFLDKAIANYRKFLEKNPKNIDARVELAICYSENNNFPEATKVMQEALNQDPKHLDAHFHLGIIYLRAQNPETATEWFKKTYELSPNSTIGQRAKQLLGPRGVTSSQ